MYFGEFKFEESFLESLREYCVKIDSEKELYPKKLIKSLHLLPVALLEKEILIYNESNGAWVNNIDMVIRDLLDETMRILQKENKDDFLISYLNHKRYNSTYRRDIKNEIRIKGVDIRHLVNSEKDKICVKNGVVDLKNKKLLKFDKNYYFTESIDFNYEPNAKSHDFEKVMTMFQDNERMFIRFIAGQGLIGEQVQDKVFIFYSNGVSGKSTFLHLLSQTSPGKSLTNAYGRSAFLSYKNKYNDLLERRTMVLEYLTDYTVDIQNLKDSLSGKKLEIKEYGKSKRIGTPITTIYSTTNRSKPNKGRNGNMNEYLDSLLYIPLAHLKNIDYKLFFNGNVELYESFLSWRIDGAYDCLNNVNHKTPKSISDFNKKIRN